MVRRTASNPPTDYNPPPRAGSGGSIDPDGEQSEKGSAIYRMKLLMENLFSYRGIFWTGVAIAIGAFIGNVWFYYGLMTGVAGLGFILGILFAIAISFGTSLFQLMPKLQTATARMSLHQIFVAGSKPNAIPELDPNVVADAKNLIADYREAEIKRRDFFQMARRLSLLTEGFLGVMFIGNIGAGGSALFSLIGFALSVCLVEAGVTLALKAGEDELPPQIKQQLEGLLRNDGKNLRLRGL